MAARRQGGIGTSTALPRRQIGRARRGRADLALACRLESRYDGLSSGPRFWLGALCEASQVGDTVWRVERPADDIEGARSLTRR